MKSQAIYNWQIAEQKRLRKDRIIGTLVGVPVCFVIVVFLGSVDSLVELFIKSIGL